MPFFLQLFLLHLYILQLHPYLFIFEKKSFREIKSSHCAHHRKIHLFYIFLLFFLLFMIFIEIDQVKKYFVLYLCWIFMSLEMLLVFFSFFFDRLVDELGKHLHLHNHDFFYSENFFLLKILIDLNWVFFKKIPTDLKDSGRHPFPIW